MAHWTEEFFVDNADLFHQELDQREDRATNEVSKLLSILSEEFEFEPSNVLDVGCGLGRHCRAFASEGIDATGVDISPTYVAEGRKRAEEAGLNERIDLQELDMRKLDSLNDEYELIVSLYNTFGYFDDKTNLQVLQQMRNRIAPGGVCVIQTMNKDAITSSSREYVRETASGLVVEQTEFDSKSSRITITRDVLRGNAPNLEHAGRVEYTVRLYSPPELIRILKGAGFEETSVFGGYEGESPSIEAGRLVALAR